MPEDIPIARLETKWTQDDFMELNTKARSTLTHTLTRNKYKKICRLKTSKEVWDSLCVSYEGIEDVILRKDATLMRHSRRLQVLLIVS